VPMAAAAMMLAAGWVGLDWVGAQPEEGRHFVGRVDGRSPQIFDVVEENNLFLVVRDKN
jgi:hypothetical protein